MPGFDSPWVFCSANPGSPLARVRQIHAIAQSVFRPGCARSALYPGRDRRKTGLGAQGAEAEPNRMQQWLVPSPAPDVAARARLFRPPGDGPFRLAVIAHASTQNVLRRAQMPQPEYRALAALAGGARLCRAGAANVPAMAPPADAIWKTRAAATKPTTRAPDAPPPMRSRRRRALCASNPSSGRTAWSLSGTPPAPGVRWRWPAKIRKTSRPSLRSRPAAAAMPTTCPTRFARRIR